MTEQVATNEATTEQATIQGTPFTFHFKSRKILNETGEVIGRTKKQPSMTVGIATPDANELVRILQEGGIAAKLIVSAVEDVIYQQARSQLDDVIESFGADDSKAVTADHLNHSELTLEFIASIPPAQRGGPVISEETWNEFFQNYVAVMQAATGKEASRLAKHVEIFKRPQRQKDAKDVLAVMVEQLDIYMASAGDAASATSIMPRMVSCVALLASVMRSVPASASPRAVPCANEPVRP
jgi:hypothetical protein